MAIEKERELSVRAVVLGAVLSAVLASANAYLGLFAGMTVSASIPAAVLSMGLLRAVRGTILENNLVQTAASSGEAAAAGAIFTLPALILLGSWAKFDLLLSGALIGLGGLLGVLFTILLRRPLVVSGSLPFPEGVATAEVLRAGHNTGSGALARGAFRRLAWGAGIGGLAKWIESGFSWSRSVVEGAFATPFGAFYGGLGTSPALISVGAIVGLEVALVVSAGGVINWLLFVPFVAEVAPGGSVLEAVWAAWSEKTRYLGVGAMTVGGVYALYLVRASMVTAFRAGVVALLRPQEEARSVALAERDLSMRWIFAGTGLCVFPLVWIFHSLLGGILFPCLLAVLVLVFGFLFSSVAAYMAGLLGSSNNPVSGVTIATILFTSLLLSFLGVSAVVPEGGAAAGPAAAILVGSVVCTAAAIGGDNVQDLRAGHLLGATPYRQQIMQLVGVGVAAIVLGPVLQLLLTGYGFGAPTVEHPDALRAPQATLMASVAKGVFGGELPWKFFFVGAGMGLLAIILDQVLARREGGFRLPVLGLALGLYLPLELSTPILVGGILSHVGKRLHPSAEAERSGLLAGAGLITGEALMGIVLAALVASLGSLDALKVGGPVDSALLSLLIFGGCGVFLYRAIARGGAEGAGSAERD